jgi:hypothetical protein
MKEVITKDFGELEYVKIFDTLNMYLVAKEGADGQPSTKTQAVFNVITDPSGKKQKRDPRPPKPGKAKRGRFNNLNKRNNQQTTSKPGKERCSHCGDPRHDEPNCWKKHPELDRAQISRGGHSQKYHRLRSTLTRVINQVSSLQFLKLHLILRCRAKASG